MDDVRRLLLDYVSLDHLHTSWGPQQELDHVQANFAGDTMDETWSLPRSYAPSEASLTSLLRRPQYESGYVKHKETRLYEQ
jgi:hypothetical protein